MRDLYELTTPDIDELTDIILGHPGVYGARLMGGGFGGNVLALVSKEHVAELVDRVQSGYYAPRGRDGLAEGSITVSTPGEGFSFLCLRDVLHQAVVSASAIWWKWETYAPVIGKSTCELLGIPRADAFKLLRPIQPIIVAGGRRQRRSGRGYRNPAALNVIGGKPSLARVLDSLAAMPFKTLQPMKKIPMPRGTRVVLQKEPLGTGHAVLAAIPALRNDKADVLVVWGSQPLVSADTLAHSVVAYQALGSSSMLFPTAVTRTPYAPIQRDLHGYVVASRETAAEGAPTKRLGETNIGAFLLSAPILKATLPGLHEEMWDAAAGRYKTKSGELGFPNEMARALVRAGTPVIAFPIARVEESLGLRDRAGYDEVRRIIATPHTRKPSRVRADMPSSFSRKKP